jgi:hypothetical protein
LSGQIIRNDDGSVKRIIGEIELAARPILRAGFPGSRSHCLRLVIVKIGLTGFDWVCDI